MSAIALPPPCTLPPLARVEPPDNLRLLTPLTLSPGVGRGILFLLPLALIQGRGVEEPNTRAGGCFSVSHENLAEGCDEALILSGDTDGDSQGRPETISGRRADGHSFLRQGANHLLPVPFDIDADKVRRCRHV